MRACGRETARDGAVCAAAAAAVASRAGGVRVGRPHPPVAQRSGQPPCERCMSACCTVVCCICMLWPVWVIHAVRRAASAARSPAAGCLFARVLVS